MPTHVNGVGHMIASAMRDSARGLPIDWGWFKDMIVATGPRADAPMKKSEGDLKGYEDNVHEADAEDQGDKVDIDEDETNEMLEIEWLCDKC